MALPFRFGMMSKGTRTIVNGAEVLNAAWHEEGDPCCPAVLPPASTCHLASTRAVPCLTHICSLIHQ